MIKAYKEAKTREKFAKINELTPAVSRYYSGNDLFFDFSLLDAIWFDEAWERDAIEHDFMEHTSPVWYEQPMPTIILYDEYHHLIGQIETAIHRVYKSDGRRMCVVVELTKVNIERQIRRSIYDRDFETVNLYTAENRNASYDIEIAA